MDLASVVDVVSRRTTFECGVAAHGVVEASRSDLRALREEPGPANAPAVPPRFLRQADEQTVVGLAAVLRAMGRPALRDQQFDEWGVLVAQRFVGRQIGAGVLEKFLRDGSATVSPHAIPQLALHSTAGAISVALGMHGPNFGVGGGREALLEGLPAALTFFDPALMPGLWLVLTAWEPDPIPDGKGSSDTSAVCRGAALALVPSGTAPRLLRLTVDAVPPTPAVAPPALSSLVGRLDVDAGQSPEAIWSCVLPWGGRVELLPNTNMQRKAA